MVQALQCTEPGPTRKGGYAEEFVHGWVPQSIRAVRRFGRTSRSATGCCTTSSRSRTPGYPGAPPQIPASGTTAPSSYLGSQRSVAALDKVETSRLSRRKDCADPITAKSYQPIPRSGLCTQPRHRESNHPVLQGGGLPGLCPRTISRVSAPWWQTERGVDRELVVPEKAALS